MIKCQDRCQFTYNLKKAFNNIINISLKSLERYFNSRFMKKLILLCSLSVVSLFSCQREPTETEEEIFQYNLAVFSPFANETKFLGDTMHIHVDFESMTQETIHHVKVRIYNKEDNTEVYAKPDDAHIHESSGSYSFRDDLALLESNNINANQDYILEAKIWGHGAGVEEKLVEVEFRVNPP